MLDDETLELRFPAGHGRELQVLAGRHRNLQARPTRLRYGWRAAGEGWRSGLVEILKDLAEN